MRYAMRELAPQHWLFLLLVGGAVVFMAVVAVLVVIVILAMRWRSGRTDRMLAAWAEENGFAILKKGGRNPLNSPFKARVVAGEPTAIVFIEIRDRKGRSRKGWVRLGGWYTGLLSDQVEVRWEE
jgi:hypothetical protein